MRRIKNDTRIIVRCIYFSSLIFIIYSMTTPRNASDMDIEIYKYNWLYYRIKCQK